MKPNLSDKKILVTGSTDGLGKLIAKHLAMQSAFVLLHGRSIKKGEIVLNEIYQLTQNEGLKYYNGDFASLESVLNSIPESYIHFPNHRFGHGLMLISFSQFPNLLSAFPLNCHFAYEQPSFLER